MSITKFTDSYATLEEIDLLMVSNCEWTNKSDFEKEDLIKAASQFIDSAFLAAGDPISESQPMQFLRDFSGTSEKLFQTTEQERRLKMAVYYQLSEYLRNIPAGLVNTTEQSEIVEPIMILSNNTKTILKIYEYNKNLANSNIWY